MDELEVKIEQTQKDYYKVTLYKYGKLFFSELERSEIMHIIGVLDNAI